MNCKSDIFSRHVLPVHPDGHVPSPLLAGDEQRPRECQQRRGHGFHSGPSLVSLSRRGIAASVQLGVLCAGDLRLKVSLYSLKLPF